MLEKICSPEELEQIDSSLFKDNKKLLNTLIEKDIGMVLDWKYEPPEAIKAFIENRITQLKLKPISLKAEHLEEEHEQNADNEVGDFLPFVLENLEKQLKNIKARIVCLETHGDTYIIFIADDKSAKNLTHIKSDFWQFTTLKKADNATMYIIHCPKCDRMDVWCLPIDNRPPYEGGNPKTEPSEPYEQCCDSCHALYWDKNGKLAGNVVIEAENCYDSTITNY